MKIFTNDWFSNNIPIWNTLLNKFKTQDNLKFLEIGSYEGKSACWLLDNILTKNNCELYCIDTFQGSYEHKLNGSNHTDFKNVYDTFKNNTVEYGDKIKLFVGKSGDLLKNPNITKNTYDFIYIDGCHESKEVLQDAVFAFEILKNGGIIIFDDYLWGNPNDKLMTPKISVDSFIECYKKYIKILHKDYQVAIEKHE